MIKKETVETIDLVFKIIIFFVVLPVSFISLASLLIYKKYNKKRGK